MDPKLAWAGGFTVAGVVIFQLFKDSLLADSPGFNLTRVIVAAIVGGAFAGIGYGVGYLLEKRRG